jgi:heme-degrading monooxygenase HmoA
MVLVVFRIELAPDRPVDEYERTGARMADLVQSMPGFLGMDYAEVDGGELLVVRFESHDSLSAWRNHPEHLAAQERGKREFFKGYQIEVCDLVRSYGLHADADAILS